MKEVVFTYNISAFTVCSRRWLPAETAVRGCAACLPAQRSLNAKWQVAVNWMKKVEAKLVTAISISCACTRVCCCVFNKRYLFNFSIYFLYFLIKPFKLGFDLGRALKRYKCIFMKMLKEAKG